LRPHKTCALMMEIRGREIRTTEVDDKDPAYLPASPETKFKDGFLLKPGQ
jgi:hypothetical protein